ncbi:MAG: class I SAM-dependent methyltransferase [bacterium]
MDKKCFFNSQANIWDKTYWYNEEKLNRVKSLIKRFKLKPGMTVLDLATGTGVLLPLIQNDIGHDGKLFALDYSYEMLKAGKNKGLQGQIHFLLADVNKIPIKKCLFDRIICFSAFPHFHNKISIIRNCLSIQKPGGLFFIAHITNSEKLNKMHKISHSTVKNDYMPSKKQFAVLLRKAGIIKFNIVENKDIYCIEIPKSVY